MATAPLIEVSEAATEKLSEILTEQGEEGSLLRMMVVPGPHGSFQYMLGTEKEPKSDDFVITAASVQVLVDPESAPLVEGAQIDLVLDDGHGQNVAKKAWRRRHLGMPVSSSPKMWPAATANVVGQTRVVAPRKGPEECNDACLCHGGRQEC